MSKVGRFPSRSMNGSEQCPRDGTIISGDSLGTVKFWDVKTSTQIKSIKAHDADVLCLTVGSVRLVFSIVPRSALKSLC